MTNKLQHCKTVSMKHGVAVGETSGVDLLLLRSLHSKPVIQGGRGDPTAEGPQHPTGTTQDAKVAQEAQGYAQQLPLQQQSL